MPLDLADRHAARVHRHDLLVEARETALIARDQLRIEAPLPVVWNLDVDLRRLGENGLLRIAVAMIGLSRRCFAFKMIVQLGVQNPFRQSFL